eukprot:RCo022877
MWPRVNTCGLDLTHPLFHHCLRFWFFLFLFLFLLGLFSLVVFVEELTWTHGTTYPFCPPMYPVLHRLLTSLCLSPVSSDSCHSLWHASFDTSSSTSFQHALSLFVCVMLLACCLGSQ